MRTPVQLIQAALADATFHGIRERPEHDTGAFKVYQVVLTGQRYRGLQPNWFFAVLTGPEPGSYDDIQTSARALIARVATSGQRLTPLVFLAEHPAARLADMCRVDPRDVFGIDHTDLPSARQANSPVRAPFVMAVRAKYGETGLSSYLFQPYSPKVPAEGWRFFGRRRELDELVRSPGNFFVVGARMTGKTSLLKEAGRLLQQEHGAQVHYVPLQFLQGGTHEIVREILLTVAERESVTAVRRSQMLDEPLLESVLKRLSRSRAPVVLILDELGNVLGKGHQRGTDWSLIGMLREYSHAGGIRVLMSGFQEFFVRQSDFEGPFVNFARTIRLSGFSNAEIDECLVQPLQFWGHIAPTELLELAATRVGRHPLLLQYFGKALFEKVARRPNGSDVNAAASSLLDSNGIEIFEDAFDELFMRTGTACERFLFLKRCREADVSNTPLVEAEITDAWARDALTSIGHTSNYDERRLLLESLELKSLTTSVGGNRSRQRIAAPIIYTYLKYSEPELDELIGVLAEDARARREPTVKAPPADGVA